jgi:hypothetical protein
MKQFSKVGQFYQYSNLWLLDTFKFDSTFLNGVNWDCYKPSLMWGVPHLGHYLMDKTLDPLAVLMFRLEASDCLKE